MKVEQWLGEDNVLGADIWHKKYQHGEETFDEWLDRIAKGDLGLRSLIMEKKFLFGGRILANRGLADKGKKITYSNCYVIEAPEDNIESIFDCGKKLARTYSYGGGCGIDISKLRPSGSKVNNASESTSGATSFMDLYSMVTQVIGQEGRRGALMISIDCMHPDIEQFIMIKSDLDKITKANLSIRVTDEFMNAVEQEKEITLRFEVKDTGEVITKKVNASELFDKFIQMNYDMAEPALLYWDNIEHWNLLSNTPDFEFAGVNPCFTGDMKLLTTDGYQTFESLVDKKFKCVNINGEQTESKVWKSGHKEIVEIRFTNKKEIHCTPDHTFMLNDGTQCMAKDLRMKRPMPSLHEQPFLEKDDVFIKLGFIQGDGQLNNIFDRNQNGIEVNIGKNDKDILTLFQDNIVKEFKGRHAYVYGFMGLIDDYGFSDNSLPHRVFPMSYNTWDKVEKSSFLQGCFSANGCVNSNRRISYKTTCLTFATQLQNTLRNDFNIYSNITTNKSKITKFENGDYTCKESYDININQYESIVQFYYNINFYHQYKKDALVKLITVRSPIVDKIEYIGTADVYDFTEPQTHWGVVHGVIVHNCAEEPLPAFGSCLLGSINLAEFVFNPFTNDSSFDENGFSSAVAIATKALNDVLDEGLPLHPLKEQRDSVAKWRQIGLGVFGIADMLIKLGITYGSAESIDMCDYIAKLMAQTAIEKSQELGSIYGAYEGFVPEVYDTEYYRYVMGVSEDAKIYALPLRNSQLLTIAPTGTLSTMLGVSGGIEPIFANSYTRRTQSLHGEDKTYTVYTPIVEKYMKDTFDKVCNDDNGNVILPKYFVTSSDISYSDRIRMQGVWQDYIDASISSTINLPTEATHQDIKNIYLEAWKANLKGITVYRAGCKREGILIETPKKEPVVEVVEIAGLPATLCDACNSCGLQRGDIINVSDELVSLKRTIVNGCGKFYLHLDFDDVTGEPLETFIDIGSGGGCERNLQFISRLISLLLRAGVDVSEIIDQSLSIRPCKAYTDRTKSKGDTAKGTSCPSAIGWALKDLNDKIQTNYTLSDDLLDVEYTDEWEDEVEPVKPELVHKPVHKPLCPECAEELLFEGGCVVCKNCGYSKCD